MQGSIEYNCLVDQSNFCHFEEQSDEKYKIYWNIYGMNNYYVYILTTNKNKIFYVWVTNDLSRRIYEHKNKLVDWFTKKYNVTKLIYYEE